MENSSGAVATVTAAELAAALTVDLERIMGLYRSLTEPGGLSLTAAATLAAIERFGPQRLTALAAREGVTQPAMTQLISRLEDAGQVRRESDPDDGRVVLVTITDEGRATLAHRRDSRATRLARHPRPAQPRPPGRARRRPARARRARQRPPRGRPGPQHIALRRTINVSGVSPTPAASPFKQPKAVFAVAFACVVSFMGIGLVDPILPAISNQLHASPSETTLLFTSYLVVTAVAMLITNWVSSRIGAKWTMIAGLVLIVAFSALAGSSGSIREIIEFRAGWGVGNALFIATSLAVIVASASGGFAGAIVLYETALGLGIAVGPLVGGTLGEISWRGPFYGVSVLMAISLCATVVLVDKTPKPPTKTSLSAPFKALRHRGLLTMALTALCYNWGFFTILGYAPFPMELSPIKLGLVFFGWGIMVAVFAVFGAPWLQRRLGIARTMYANLFIFALISLGIAIWTLNKPALIILVIVSGIVCGVNNTVTTQAVMTVSPVERPVASAAYSFVRFIGGGLAPYAAGRLVLAFNIHVPFYIGAGAILLGIVILSTGHKLLGEAERTQAAAAASAVGHGATSPEAAAERELEAEEKAEALLGDAD